MILIRVIIDIEIDICMYVNYFSWYYNEHSFATTVYSSPQRETQ